MLICGDEMSESASRVPKQRVFDLTSRMFFKMAFPDDPDGYEAKDLIKVVKAVQNTVVLAKRKDVSKLVKSNRRQLKIFQKQVAVFESGGIQWKEEEETAVSLSSVATSIGSVLQNVFEEEELSPQVPIVTSSTNEDEFFQLPMLTKSSSAVSTVFVPSHQDQNEREEFIEVPITTIPHVKRLPPYSTWVNTPRNYVVHDDEERCHCPYFDESTFKNDPNLMNDLDDYYNSDDEHINVGDMSIFYDTVTKLHEFEKRTKSANWQDEMWSRMIKETTVVRSYTSVLRTTPEFKRACPEDLYTPSMAAFEALFEVTRDATPEKLRQKFVQLLKKWHPIMRNLHTPGSDLDVFTNTTPIERVTSLDSYRQIFCRKCFLYNCTNHIHDGISSEFITKKAIPKLSPPIPCSVSCYLHDKLANGKKHLRSSGRMNWDEKENEIRKWEANDVSLCRVLLPVFPQNYCLIAEIMGTNCRKVEEFVKKEEPKTNSELDGRCNTAQPLSTSGKALGIRKNTSKTIWTKGTACHTQFLKTVYKPCFHPGTLCTSAVCSCIGSQTPCEKFCVCAVDCVHRARGCHCLGRCDTRVCPCHAAQRECDPELCIRCGANRYGFEFTSCRNVGIQRHVRKHLKMGESGIPDGGWGIFTLEHIIRGEFICEYVGELITDSEADRRGLEYQKRCHTFLFELNEEYSVDAVRKGSKIRFANHADRPNTIVKVMKVNTDHRIGVYAFIDIFPGEELFLNYKQVIDEHKAVQRRGSSKLRRRRYPSKTATKLFPMD